MTQREQNFFLQRVGSLVQIKKDRIRSRPLPQELRSAKRKIDAFHNREYRRKQRIKSRIEDMSYTVKEAVYLRDAKLAAERLRKFQAWNPDKKAK